MSPIDGDAVQAELAKDGLTERMIDAAPTIDLWEATKRDALQDPPTEGQTVLVRLGGSRFITAYAVGYRTGGTFWLNDEAFSVYAREISGWWPLPGDR